MRTFTKNLPLLHNLSKTVIKFVYVHRWENCNFKKVITFSLCAAKTFWMLGTLLFPNPRFTKWAVHSKWILKFPCLTAWCHIAQMKTDQKSLEHVCYMYNEVLYTGRTLIWSVFIAYKAFHAPLKKAPQPPAAQHGSPSIFHLRFSQV